MHAWLNGISQLTKTLLGQPGSTVELVVMLVVGALGFLITLMIIGGALGCGMTEPGRCGAALIMTVVVLVAVSVAANLYLVPASAGTAIRISIPLALALAAFAGAVVPAVKFFLKGKYSQVLFSLLISIAAAAALMALVRAGFHATRAGGEGVEKARQRNERIKDIL